MQHQTSFLQNESWWFLYVGIFNYVVVWLYIRAGISFRVLVGTHYHY